MLHAKVMIVDATKVGSINFDNRSFALNDELNLSVRDRGIVAEFEKHFRPIWTTRASSTWPSAGLAAADAAKELASAAVRREL